MGCKCAANFFTGEELARIREAVGRAEAHTSGEIVPMVVDRSDSYREAEILGAVLLAAFAALLAELAVQLFLTGGAAADWTHGGLEPQTALHAVSVWTFIPLAIVLFFPMRLLVRRFERLKLLFVSRRRIGEAVRERAVRAFYEKGLYRTRDETGVLLFLSLLEHKVWILGDRGIDRKIAPDSWRELAGTLSRGMGEGRACESLCNVIEACGRELARHFPRREDDTDELKNDLLH